MIIARCFTFSHEIVFLNVLSYRNWTACVCTRDAAVWTRPGPDRTDGLEPVRSEFVTNGLERFISLWSVHITIKLT